MRLLSDSEFSIRQASPYSEMEMATSELLLNGKPSGIIVVGAVLEAALEWHGHRVAFLTDDVPFEEMLRIYLFDPDMKMVDAAELGWMYSTGVFSDLDLAPPSALTFEFFGGTTWRMVLLPEPEFALPYISDPRGVHRKFKFSRRFRVEGKMHPEGTPDIVKPAPAITR